ncbi:MAG: hypothetical protein WCE81_13130 [Halobacteriota archaeon]
MTDTNTTRLMITPTAQVVALYAEYDGLLDTLEAVQLQLKSKRCRDQITHNKLRMQIHDICEALADVHEKIADFVIM